MAQPDPPLPGEWPSVGGWEQAAANITARPTITEGGGGIEVRAVTGGAWQPLQAPAGAGPLSYAEAVLIAQGISVVGQPPYGWTTANGGPGPEPGLGAGR